MLRRSLNTYRICLGLALLAFFWSACSATPAAAQQIDAGAFTLKISEKEMKLQHPADMMWDKYLMWDLPFQRVNNRNMPYLELKNDSESNGPITEFHLTIGDDRFNFSKAALGVYALLGSTTPGFALTSNTVGGLGNELVVNFGNGGLKPGQFVRFKIDIDVDAAFANQFFNMPDYRTVLFDMNGLNVYDGNLQDFDTADNAKASAIIKPTGGAAYTVGPNPFEDEIVADRSGQFFNQHRRPYRESGFDMVRTFQLVSAPVVIPEPGSAVIAVIGVVGGLLTARRPRRSVRTA